MKNITQAELCEIARKHKMWLEGYPEGQRASLHFYDFSHCDFKCINFSYADFSRNHFSYNDFTGSNFSNANFAFSNFDFCNLSDTDFNHSNFSNTVFYSCNISYSDLSCSNFECSNLGNSYIVCNDLTDTINMNYPINCPEKGQFIGYKKAHNYIIELLIPEDAKRTSGTSRQCRCSKAKVLNITDFDGNIINDISVGSDYDASFIYKVGEWVEVNNFCENRWNDCSEGIHFFITRQEAINY